MSFPSTWWFKVSQRIWQPGSLTDRFCQTAIWQLGWRSVWCPGFLTQMSAIPPTHPILTEDRSWFFLAKYPQYGQPLLLRNSRLLLSHVASWRLDGGYFFLYLSSHYSLNPANSHRDCCNHGGQTPCWNVHVQISRRLWRGVSFHWAVRCGSLIFRAAV